MNQSTKLIQNGSKEIKSDNFCYRKVGSAITKWGAIEKSPILLSQYWKNYHFLRVTKIYRILMVAIIFSSTVFDVTDQITIHKG